MDLILKKLASGDTVNDLIEAYTKIKKEDITACLLFAADAIKNEVRIKTTHEKMLAKY